MSDDLEKGGTIGEVVSFVYVGDHYRFKVRTESGCDFTIIDEDLWNEHDQVSIVIDKEQLEIHPLEDA